ncbi:FtsB family cell division protein [Aliikangiella sp. IMCC44653]
MKILGLVFCIIIIVLQYRIWLGEGSVHKINQLESRITEQKQQNDLLLEQNTQLKQEIKRLRQNPELLEEIAREKLGLVKPNETFYRVIPSEAEKQ